MKESFCDLKFITNEGNVPVILYVSNRKMDFKAIDVYKKVKLRTDTEFDFCELLVDDWDSMLTPWGVSNCLKNRKFSGWANELLTQITDEIIPAIDKRFPNHRQVYIAGYSLAGLFSLWTLYQSKIFDGAVCCSGSLWYPGWEEYMMQSSLAKDVKVYLSLGKKEPKNKHPLLQRVGDITLKQYEVLKQDKNVKALFFEWNNGGHFSDVVDRIAKGICLIIFEEIYNEAEKYTNCSK